MSLDTTLSDTVLGLAELARTHLATCERIKNPELAKLYIWHSDEARKMLRLIEEVLKDSVKRGRR